MKRVLLLSGGIDSTCLALSIMPDATLFVDYGQRARDAESRAAQIIAETLGLEHAQLTIDLSSVSSGLMAPTQTKLQGGPSPEWWPYRNQFLATAAAAWLIAKGEHLFETSAGTVILGTVANDAKRHIDGTMAFYSALDSLISMQEGAVRVVAPAIHQTTTELIRSTRAPAGLLAWTHSCHTGVYPCNACPGCYKRANVLFESGLLQ